MVLFLGGLVLAVILPYQYVSDQLGQTGPNWALGGGAQLPKNPHGGSEEQGSFSGMDHEIRLEDGSGPGLRVFPAVPGVESWNDFSQEGPQSPYNPTPAMGMDISHCPRLL